MLPAPAPRPERVAAQPAALPRARALTFPLALGGAVALVTLVPYLLAYLMTPPGKHFMGFFFLADDAATYLAKLRTGREGGWLWDNHYVSVPPPRVLVYTFYTAFGHLAALLHLPLIATYHLARVTGGAALAVAVYALAGELRLTAPGRRAAALLAFFGSGFGFIFQLLGNPQVGPLRLEAVDLHLPELTGFFSTLAIPHFAWAAALLATGILLVLRTISSDSLAIPLLAGLVWNALALIHPQMIPIAGVFITAWLALRFTTREPPPVRALLRVALSFALTGPLLAYDAWLLWKEPMVAHWAQTWTHSAPDPVSLSLSQGIPLLLALLGLRRAWRDRAGLAGLLGCWLVVVGLFLYLPNAASIQRRLLDGLYIPIALLAARWLFAQRPPGPRPARRRARLILALSGFSSVLVLAIAFEFALGAFPMIYESADTAAAFRWLESAPRGGVLADPRTGLYLPGWTGQRTFVGHYSETVDYRQRAGEAGAILRAATPDPDVAGFFQRQQLRYLFWGPTEREARDFDPASKAYFDLVFSRSAVQIYEFGAR